MTDRPVHESSKKGHIQKAQTDKKNISKSGNNKLQQAGRVPKCSDSLLLFKNNEIVTLNQEDGASWMEMLIVC